MRGKMVSRIASLLLVGDVPRSESYGIGLRTVVGLLACSGSFTIMWGVLRASTAFSTGEGGWPLAIGTIFIAYGLITLSVANSIGRVAVRHLTEVVYSHLEIQDKVFILYLRAFTEDGSMGQPGRLSMVGSVLRTYISLGLTEEQQLARVLEPVGEMVAVGVPEELLPFAGATRLYLPAEEWCGPVRKLMQSARMVVITLGLSPGVIWELTEAIRFVPPERLLLTVPMTREQYNDFRQRVAADELFTSVRAADGALIPFTLPGFSGQPKTLSKLQGLIYFSSTWEAKFIPLIKYPAFHNSLRGSLAFAIRPFLQQLSYHEDKIRK